MDVTLTEGEMRLSILDLIKTLPARIGLGLTAMGSVAASLPVAPGATFSIEKTVGVALAIGGWLFAEISSHSSQPHPHDIKLFKRAQATLNQKGNMEWLREHDFGNSFPFHMVGGLHTIADEWKGEAFEFEDGQLRKSWASARAAIDELSALIVIECGPMPNDPTTATVKTLQDIQQGTRSDRTIQAAAKLNRSANEAVKRWNQFVALSRKRLNVPVG